MLLSIVFVFIVMEVFTIFTFYCIQKVKFILRPKVKKYQNIQDGPKKPDHFLKVYDSCI